MRILRDPTRHALTQGERVEVNGSPGQTLPKSLIFWCLVSNLLQHAGRGRLPHTPYFPCARHQLGDRDSRSGRGAALLAHGRIPPSSRRSPAARIRKTRFRSSRERTQFFPERLADRVAVPGYSPIYPFRCNLSQRAAVEKALTCSVSVIEGPPGTGKTETILNLIANIVAVQHMTVGIVSFGNAAVDNVRDKLDKEGFGHVIGSLGRREKRDEFFAGRRTATPGSRGSWPVRLIGQTSSSWRIWTGASAGCRAPSASAPNGGRRSTPTGWSCRHFEGHLHRDELPDLVGLPLLRRSADRVLGYLAESELELAGVRPGPLRRIRITSGTDPCGRSTRPTPASCSGCSWRTTTSGSPSLSGKSGGSRTSCGEQISSSFPSSTTSCRFSSCIPNSPPGARNRGVPSTARTPTGEA